MSQKRVIVIGSGIAGLACARELVQRGHDVLVVEARSRVGGRLKGESLELHPMRTDPNEVPSSKQLVARDESDNSHPIDLGGTLIHGIDENPIHSISTQMGLKLHEISDQCLLLDESGWPFDPKEDEKLATLFNNCLDETFRRVEKNKKSRRTFGDLFDIVCQDMGLQPTNPLLKWHQANLELPTGADFHELGYTWNDDEPYGFSGAHAAVPTSWKIVTEHLAEGLSILFNSPVTKIQVVKPDGSTPTTHTTKPAKKTKSRANGNGLAASGAAPGPGNSAADDIPVKVITRTEWRNAKKPKSADPIRTSRRIRGDTVDVRRSSRATKGKIQRLEIGHEQVLSYDDSEEKKSRSKRKRERDSALPLDSKVHVTLDDGRVLSADAVVCTLPLGVLKIPEGEVGHIDFAPSLPKFKKSAIDSLGCGLLNKCAISFQSIFWQDSDFLGMAAKDHSYLILNAAKYTRKPILIFMYGGSFAHKIEDWTDSDIMEDCMSVLRQVSSIRVPPPVDYCVTRWGKESYSRMAFTYVPPGVDGSKQLTAAGEPLYDPVATEKPLIMFAGEHTTPYHPSTMHGAFLSGIREAYRYDLFVAPGLNDHLEFDSDEKLYERTFHVRKVYDGVDVLSSGPVKNKSDTKTKTQHRRNRLPGISCQKQAKEIISDTERQSSRRSQRSPSKVMKTPEASPAEIKNDLNALEDRILLRSLDSYGRDFSLIQSKILPVFGSTRKRTPHQIQRRWQQLAPRKRRARFWKAWSVSEQN